MNGRLDKVAMTARIMRMKTGLYEKTWYPEWDDRQKIGRASCRERV